MSLNKRYLDSDTYILVSFTALKNHFYPSDLPSDDILKRGQYIHDLIERDLQSKIKGILREINLITPYCMIGNKKVLLAGHIDAINIDYGLIYEIKSLQYWQGYRDLVLLQACFYAELYERFKTNCKYDYLPELSGIVILPYTYKLDGKKIVDLSYTLEQFKNDEIFQLRDRVRMHIDAYISDLIM
ncbi:hypothetical protein HRbin04_00489 [archaeon HR04]|nr:hypothetical protein HRbin04_00489 [archaeon HR04]